MNERYLFGNNIHAKELARNEDPATSKLSAERLVKTGELGAKMDAALALVRAGPGSTASELDPSGVGSIISKRLNDLNKIGLVRKDGARKCKVTGRMAQLWHPIGPHREDIRW